MFWTYQVQGQFLVNVSPGFCGFDVNLSNFKFIFYHKLINIQSLFFFVVSTHLACDIRDWRVFVTRKNRNVWECPIVFSNSDFCGFSVVLFLSGVVRGADSFCMCTTLFGYYRLRTFLPLSNVSSHFSVHKSKFPDRFHRRIVFVSLHGSF